MVILASFASRTRLRRHRCYRRRKGRGRTGREIGELVAGAAIVGQIPREIQCLFLQLNWCCPIGNSGRRRRWPEMRGRRRSWRVPCRSQWAVGGEEPWTGVVGSVGKGLHCCWKLLHLMRNCLNRWFVAGPSWPAAISSCSLCFFCSSGTRPRPGRSWGPHLLSSTFRSGARNFSLEKSKLEKNMNSQIFYIFFLNLRQTRLFRPTLSRTE